MMITRDDFKYESLIPDIQNPSPDYYCTWQTQLYATSDGKPEKQREIISEKALFDSEKPYGWAYFYEQARGDLIFVMDDSWDVPMDGNPDYYGSLVLNIDKFPSFVKNNSPEEALKQLADKMKSFGWKSLGGWVCAGESKLFEEKGDEYWIKRLKWSEKAGFTYWKVDWGKEADSLEFRKHLSELAHQYAPSLVIENAMVKESIPFSDAYRTYDVPAIMSIPMTMEKMQNFLDVPSIDSGFSAIINCEDEVYMAASLGCSMGIMRNPYVGNLPDGKPDPSFPDCHRRLKTKMAEITRAVRWHRIAPAFGICGENTYISDVALADSWNFKNKDAEIEQWWFDMDAVKSCMDGDVITKTAPSAISRNMPLPKVTADENGDIPYITLSENPNGAVSVATIGRTRGRRYWIPKCDVEIECKNADTFGIFGEYKTLKIMLDYNINECRIFAQDLADNRCAEITDLVGRNGKVLTISGELIQLIGTMCQNENDTSEAGLVIKAEAEHQ